jgi:hypothetical protein
MTYDNLKELAEKFFEQPGVSDIQMRFKEDRVIYPAINAVIDSRIDPLTLWSWAQCQNPKTLFVLKDWYNKDGNSGTVRESVEWSKQRWQDESKWDPTLTRLFWEWSRSDFTSNGGAWVINDVWGLKNTESATSSLSPKILDIGFKEIVQPIIAANHFEKIHEGEHNIPIRESFPEIDHFKLWGHCPPASWGGYWAGEITDADDPHRYRSDAEIIKDIEAQEAEKDRIGRELAKTHKTQWINYVGVEIKECMKSPGMVCAGQLARWYDEARGDRPVA